MSENKREPRLPCGTCYHSDEHWKGGILIGRPWDNRNFKSLPCFHSDHMKYDGSRPYPQDTEKFNFDGLCQFHSERGKNGAA
jgi:hypothetical protein